MAAFEDSEGNAAGQVLPIYKSDDNGDTWQKLVNLAPPAALSSSAAYSTYLSNWTNPYFYVLPSALGSLPAGTLMLADVVSNADRSKDAIVLYDSTNQGASWTILNTIATGPDSGDPVWEPYLMMYNGQLVAYYSDENDYLSSSNSTGVPTIDPNNTTDADSGGQVLVHRTWSGSGSWSGPVIDVSGDTATTGGRSEIGSGRPGMTNVVQTSDGKWLLTYEFWGGGDNVRYKVASNPLQFFSVGGADGTNITNLPVASGSGALSTGGSPVLLKRPDGSILYNAAGSGDVWVDSTGSSTGTWKELHTSVPAGYSRDLQNISATGQVLIVQAPWGTGPVSYAELDLGHSTGAYFTVTNRATGQVLATVQSKTQDFDLDGNQPDIITWSNENGNDTQKWHEVAKGSAVTFLNEGGGRSLGILSGKPSAGQDVVQWVDDGGLDKQWKLIAATNGYIKIQSVKDPSYYMTGNGLGGTVTVQTAQSPSTAQEWLLTQQ